MFRKAIQTLTSYVPARNLIVRGQIVPGLHEPEYLEQLRPKVGFYPKLNVQLKCYDYVILEKYQSYIDRLMRHRLKINVTNAWSTPHQEIQVEILKHQSNAIDSTFNLKLYERNIHAEQVLVTDLPILIDMIHHTLPQGVTFSILEHSKADEDKRYYRDSVLEKLMVELEELKETPLIGN